MMTPLPYRFAVTAFAALLALLSCQSRPEPYGCSIDMVLTDGTGMVNGRYHLHNTGIRLQQGNQLSISAWGTVCLEDGTCSSADGENVGTYGLYAKIGDSPPFFAGSSYDRQVIDTGTLQLVIPEAYDIAQCEERAYIDNSGRFEVIVKVNGR